MDTGYDSIEIVVSEKVETKEIRSQKAKQGHSNTMTISRESNEKTRYLLLCNRRYTQIKNILIANNGKLEMKGKRKRQEVECLIYKWLRTEKQGLSRVQTTEVCTTYNTGSNPTYVQNTQE